MSAEALRSLTERLSKTAGIPGLHPHLIRHTYATRFLLNGGDSLLLQQNLDHTSLEMVREYVHIASRMIALLSQGFSPLDNIKMDGTRRFRHSFNGEGRQGQIYPNPASLRGRKRGGGGEYHPESSARPSSASVYGNRLAAAEQRCETSGQEEFLHVVDGHFGGVLHQGQPDFLHCVPGRVPAFTSLQPAKVGLGKAAVLGQPVTAYFLTVPAVPAVPAERSETVLN